MVSALLLYPANGAISFYCFIRLLIIFLLMQKEEFSHTAYATNAYVTVGPLAKQVLQGKIISPLLYTYIVFWIGLNWIGTLG